MSFSAHDIYSVCMSFEIAIHSAECLFFFSILALPLFLFLPLLFLSLFPRLLSPQRRKLDGRKNGRKSYSNLHFMHPVRRAQLYEILSYKSRFFFSFFFAMSFLFRLRSENNLDSNLLLLLDSSKTKKLARAQVI